MRGRNKTRHDFGPIEIWVKWNTMINDSHQNS
jgi:hypothetical protein